MTRPSEFIEWLARPEHDNLQADDLAWLAYLEGRDARPVVVPEIIVQKGRFAVYRCPDCLQGAIGRGFNYCDNCGVKLNWSKADD